MSTVMTMQEPRVLHVPDYSTSAGAEAVDLARMAGLELDPWQAFVLEHALGERHDGKWAAFEVGCNVPRQNGKGAILEARELAGLYLLGERLLIHSAHQFDTSLEAFRRLLFLIEETPELSRRIKRVSRAHGEEGIELIGGQRVRFRTRTKGGGRGFSADCLILDEAMILDEPSHGALLPTLSARPNPQVWYTGSAVDQVVHDKGIVWSRVRERGHAGDDPGLAYFEWSVDDETGDGQVLGPSHIPAEIAEDPERWAQANPGLGPRITAEHIDLERRSMDPRTFAVERLGVGDWPSTDPDADAVIRVTDWRALVDRASAPDDPVIFAFDVTPGRDFACITVSGTRPDGLIHAEVVDHRRGTGWVAQRLAELVRKTPPAAVMLAGSSPAESLLEDVVEAGVEVTVADTADYVQSCGMFFDLVEQKRLRHLGTAEMDTAIRGAVKRPLVDSWAWSRKSSKVDISPLVAMTLACAQAARPSAGGYLF